MRPEVWTWTASGSVKRHVTCLCESSMWARTTADSLFKIIFLPMFALNTYDFTLRIQFLKYVNYGFRSTHISPLLSHKPSAILTSPGMDSVQFLQFIFLISSTQSYNNTSLVSRGRQASGFAVHLSWRSILSRDMSGPFPLNVRYTFYNLNYSCFFFRFLQRRLWRLFIIFSSYLILTISQWLKWSLLVKVIMPNSSSAWTL